MARNWASDLFDDNMLPTMDSREDIRRCLDCTLPPSYCRGTPGHCGPPKKPGAPHGPRKKKYIHWTPELLADVIAGRKSRRQLARELGISPTAVRNALQRITGGNDGD